MSRTLTANSSLENLRREAKRWLKALRAGDTRAIARLRELLPEAGDAATLRDVQHALALEHGFAGWPLLRAELDRRLTVPDAALLDLLRAAESGNAARVIEVLDAAPHLLNVKGELAQRYGRRTALHYATTRPSRDVITLLLERGADPNVRDDGDNALPIHFVAEKGHLDIVRQLVEAGSDPIGEGDMHELEVIGWATCYTHTHRGIAEYLLAHGARQTMFSAVALGDANAIRSLAAADASAVDKRMDGSNLFRRPLHLAVLKRQRAALETLLALGADAELRDAAQLTPLDFAALEGHPDLADVLINAGAVLELPAAIALDRHDDVERLLAQDPAALRPGGKWARVIIRASERASGEIVQRLIRHGASVHVRDDPATAVDSTHGYTALHAAAFHGNASAARALLAHGADVRAREDKYWGTPAGWAAYAAHADVAELILAGAIDIYDAIAFDKLDRIPAIVAADPGALERPFGRYVTGDRKAREWNDPRWTPIAAAAAAGRREAVALLMELGARLDGRDSSERTVSELADAKGFAGIAELLRTAKTNVPGLQPLSRDAHVATFLEAACLDWRTGGSARLFKREDAGRMLAHDPSIASANVYTAVACGSLADVRRLLDADPSLAVAAGGPRTWPPLLYLCSARLPQPAAAESAIAIAQLLLDRGADPNVFYLGGNADIHYTALTCVLGRGEEQALMHPRAPELAALLMARGADPFDPQVLYNVFAWHASLGALDESIVWLLELMHEHSIAGGRGAMWDDPSWPMFALFGAPSLDDSAHHHAGAHFMLLTAIKRNLPGVAKWMLEHGADPNSGWGNARNRTDRTLYEEALSRGNGAMAALLAQHGARLRADSLTDDDRFVMAALAMERSAVRAAVSARPELLRNPRALFEAVERDRADVVEMLLDLGVSPDVDDPANGGSHALHAAALHGAVACAQLLIARGADVDARERNHNAIPLGVASFARRPEMIELLGAYSRDAWELVYTGRVERLRELLPEMPELARTVSDAGDTPLMWLPADSAAALVIARLLIEYGADPHARNSQGVSAADIAASRGLSDVVALLTK